MNKILVLCFLVVFLGSCIDADEKPSRTFTARVVAEDDGTYTAQYWWDIDSYIDSCSAFHVSKEQAIANAKTWNDIATNKQKEVIPLEKP